MKWSEKDGSWVPKNLANHHGSSTLRERLIARGLIHKKTLEQAARDQQWTERQTEHKKELATRRKQVDALAGAQKECRLTGKRKGLGCVFCKKKETPDVYICSTCCTKLLNAGAESLRMAYLLVVWHGLEEKADALLNFIDPKVAMEVEKEVELTKDGTYAKLEVLHGTVSTHGRAAKRVRVVRDLGRKKTLPRYTSLRRAAVR